MADRLRAGKLAESQEPKKHSAPESFASRQYILAQLGKRLAAGIKAYERFAGVRIVIKPDPERPDRIMLVCGERVITIRISPETDCFIVGGSNLGKLFSANPAHLQSDEVVLLVADESAVSPFGSELTAADFLEDLLKRSGEL
ncbi:MAG TPA: hypothetical protein VJN22_06280 [Candidatus Eremiobacteraceae bacterium]|nr:hypothetical protein [Candidatus Eremiobacteraceae bacterium]